MSCWQRIRRSCRALFRKAKLDQELDEELRAHIELRTQANLAAGMCPEEARRSAVRSFGGIEQVKEVCRDLRGVGWIEALCQDARFGLRMFRKNRGFTSVAVLTIALGIGATTAIFSVVNAVLLRPMQFKEVARLVMVWEVLKQGMGTFESGHLWPVSPANFLDWRTQSKSFEQIAIMQSGSCTLADAEQPEHVNGARVSRELFSVLGVQPLLGRAFTADEAMASGPSVVVLGHSLWQRHFGGDPRLLGKAVSLTDVEGKTNTYTVVGIMPASFDFPDKSELWLPYPLDSINSNQRGGWSAKVVAKLKSGVSRAQAQSEMQVIAGRLAEAYPGNRYLGIRITSLHEHLVRNVRSLLYVFQGAVLLVFLVATANIANLLLARSECRAKEMALRLALGATRRRITRQLLTESLLLAAVGGGCGMLLAYWGLASFSKLTAAVLPRMETVSMDARVLGVCVLLSLASGFIFGLAPALRTRKADLNERLKEGGGGRGFTRSRADRLRHSVVVGEVALSLMLLVGAGLLVKSFIRLSQFRLGFEPAKLLVVELGGQGAITREMIDALSGTPGVQVVAAADDLPLSDASRTSQVTVEGETSSAAGPKPLVCEHFVTPNYFRAMGIRLLNGRGISEPDTEAAPPVVVVNEVFVRSLLGGADPIGKRLSADRHHSIVGVVEDVRQVSTDPEMRPQVYYASRQERAGTKYLVIRTQTEPMQLAASVRAVIRSVDKTRQIVSTRTMKGRIADSVLPQRFQTSLVTIFSVVGLLLAMVGIYGVVSNSVAQRTREFGIRMAVGARRADILHLVMGHTARLVAIGLGLGLAGALTLTRVLKSSLFQVSILDPTTFLVVSALLGSVALLACYVPARRASRADPLAALRYE